MTIGSCLILLLMVLSGHISRDGWTAWWSCGYILYYLVISFVAAIFCGVGGFVDLRKMYKLLAAKRRNEVDDGRVEDKK